MTIEELVRDWFAKWESGDYLDLPLSDDFSHTSPYGTISGKEVYLEIAGSNRDKFLGNEFEFHDEIFEGERACIRYKITNPAFAMEVTEWLYAENGLLKEIVSYYNVDQGPLTLDKDQ
ncbi:MAG: nuclear transport factor 2 family protein [Acidobacteria bacterium]|nr:MAG: nuclear transport factor 2 family protein [Acidobacteriota bacterium]REJ98022.1 MAG: nuclear transport factor 2 family protein [Acidobacteriota bacterium]REK16765.1 MAG: nuclear transport factor 2 family protein [Acidobacteriota bacterium]REK42676.1 MAG: nuclear transport factor 2 family protein [Acidobacteriota bacterium]